MTSDVAGSNKSTGWPLHTRILLGLAVGAIAGLAANWALGGTHPGLRALVAQVLDPVGRLFPRLLALTVVPMVFSSLILGVAGIGDYRKLGRVGLKSFGYCMVISAISVIIGITLVNTIRPGKHISKQVSQELQERYAKDATQQVADAGKGKSTDPALVQIIDTIVPVNPIQSVSGKSLNLLHLMFFALLLGIATTLVPEEKSEPFLKALEGLGAICAKLIDLVMRLAPYCVACLVFSNLALFGTDVMAAIGWYVMTVLVGLALHMFGVYSIFLKLLARVSPIEFFRRIRTVIFTAFSTSSSVATLPTTLRVSEEALGVPKSINSFVLTVGATANQNGTALYEGVTILFLAQLAGVDLTLAQQFMVAGMAILGSIGTAGLPSASIPFVVVVLGSIGVNAELIGIILGVDRILDMCRTVVNVVGDVTAAAYVARSEGYELMKDGVA